MRGVCQPGRVSALLYTGVSRSPSSLALVFHNCNPVWGWESPGQATLCHTMPGILSPATHYQKCLLRYSLPGHLQAEFEGAQVIDIHSHDLR